MDVGGSVNSVQTKNTKQTIKADFICTFIVNWMEIFGTIHGKNIHILQCAKKSINSQGQW